MFETAKLIRVGIVSVGALAAWFAYISSVKSGAVKQERARVEETGRKIDAKAQIARKRAVSDADRVLGKYYRD